MAGRKFVLQAGIMVGCHSFRPVGRSVDLLVGYMFRMFAGRQATLGLQSETANNNKQKYTKQQFLDKIIINGNKPTAVLTLPSNPSFLLPYLSSQS